MGKPLAKVVSACAASAKARRFIWAGCLTLCWAGSVAAPTANCAPSTLGDDAEDTEKATLRARRFKSLTEAVARGAELLATEAGARYAVIVYAVSAHDNRPLHARANLYFVGTGRCGYLPGHASSDEVVLQPVRLLRGTQPVELRVVADGYERLARKGMLRVGELAIWDDFVLSPLTASSAAAVVGRVWLEDEAVDLEGLAIYVDGEALAIADASGYFVAEPVSPGKVNISTHKPGFSGLYAEVTVRPRDEVTVELNGYRRRFAHVRWAYQPDGTHSFEGDVLVGTATLSSGKLSRVSFIEGFEQVGRHSDFLIRQEEDRLVLNHFDVSGPQRPASIQMKDTPFDRLFEAPNSGYDRKKKTLHPGDVFLFRCYDGKHYAMMEVLEITDQPSQEK
ncbi:MAG: hypothetical protein IID34_13770 [Planctomycetes bacterium]|nr:hypothetical protein [Planctomycetota bacterium]